MNKTGANQSGAVVHTAHSSTLGTVLVDGRGMTLYTFTDNGAAVTCTGPCTTISPPLTAAPGTTPSAPGVDSIGTAASPSGSHTFGGEWRVVTVGAGANAAPGPARAGNTNTTPEPATGGYG